MNCASLAGIADADSRQNAAPRTQLICPATGGPFRTNPMQCRLGFWKATYWLPLGVQPDAPEVTSFRVSAVRNQSIIPDAAAGLMPPALCASTSLYKPAADSLFESM